MPRNASRNTKAAILDAAMQLFSERGFRSTTVRDIAAEVGIKDASLYNHYPSKQAIFDAIIEQAIENMGGAFRSRGALFLTTDDPSGYGNIPLGALTEKIVSTFEYLFTDPYIVRTRKLLVINQFENQRTMEVYRLIFSEQPLRLQETVFTYLMGTGEFNRADARLLALEFYGPVFLMLHNGTPWSEARPIIEAHLASFYLSHASKKELP
ncbi:TetR/AcrR family transcriptional regulator [Raoultibacter phocaeensis]|uniref:TetR/AcrR family transcriptional regulator n=1 Tax=Raoultibacter phocaeensis TaxID=2479841 RepID=UPI001117C8BC|nr:TetR/AcrR family transcriptional regulator [Raoultibacter phocaeensis]